MSRLCKVLNRTTCSIGTVVGIPEEFVPYIRSSSFKLSFDQRMIGKGMVPVVPTTDTQLGSLATLFGEGIP